MYVAHTKINNLQGKLTAFKCHGAQSRVPSANDTLCQHIYYKLLTPVSFQSV